jgi:ubiquinone/menaquinone biosynthesis C-methylase UbiE
VYSRPATAEYYARLESLTNCEQLLFDKYLRPGMAILDLGVGGGRTTSYLSSIASRYVGLDYSSEMIRVCRHKFPDLEFICCDADDLSSVPDQTFDAVVFSFNGLDCLLPESKRMRCLAECHRVLRNRGVLIFSSHNPRAIFERIAWDSARLRTFAEKFLSTSHLLFSVCFGCLTALKSTHSLTRALVNSLRRTFYRMHTRTFWQGSGPMFDSAEGGMKLYFCVPAKAKGQLANAGFSCAEVLGNDFPCAGRSLVTDWYYYVAVKETSHSGDPQCE